MEYRDSASGASVWQQPSSDFPDEMAVDAGGILLAYGQDLRALDPVTGADQWKRRIGGGVTTVALDGDLAYVATQRPLFALNRRDGSILWSGKSGSEPRLLPCPDAGILVVDNPETSTLQGLDRRTGHQRWEFSCEEQTVVAGALVGDVLCVSANEAGAVGVDVSSGAVRWRLEAEGAFEEPAVAVADRFYVTNGSVHALDAATGDVAWRYTTGNDEDKVFAVRAEGDSLLAETWKGRLIALDLQSGAPRWEQSLGQVHGTTGDARHLYVRVNRNDPAAAWAVLALDRQTGAPVWELRSTRLIPDVTCIDDVLLVELRAHVLALRV